MVNNTETPAISRLLDAMEGLPVRHGLNERQKHIYCDWCSEPIYPNDDATHYLADRLVVTPEDLPGVVIQAAGFKVGDFHLLRVSHRECDSTRIPYPCEGFTEFFLDASWSPEFRLERPELMDVSSKRQGIAWDPEAAHDAAFGVLNGGVTLREMICEDPVRMGPHDIVVQFVLMGIDPRWVVEDDGSLCVAQHADEIRESIRSERNRLVEQWDDPENLPPGYRFPRGPFFRTRDESDSFDFQTDESFADDVDADTTD